MNSTQSSPDPTPSTDDRIASENNAMGFYSESTKPRGFSLGRLTEFIKINNRIIIPVAALILFIGGGTATAFITRTPNVATPFLSKEYLDKTNDTIAASEPSEDNTSNKQDKSSATESSRTDPNKKPSTQNGQSNSDTTKKNSPTSSSGNASSNESLKTTTPKLPATPAPTPPRAPTPVDPANIAGWGLPVWRDEFDSAAVSSAKWNVRERSDLGLLFDAAVPERGQVSQSSGLLHIQGAWLQTPFQRPAGQSGIPIITHRTGYLDHRNLKAGNMSFSQRWGRWEMRAKTPTGPRTLGSLAAFWLRNSNSGEIDIMEAWGYNTAAAPGGQRINTSTTTIHTQTSGSGNQKYIWHHADYQTVKTVPWDGFHTYAFELMPTYAKIIVDDKTLATITPASHPNLWNQQFFGSPLHVRLNLHIGPSVTYWGIPDVNNKAATQPLNYQVDYVRIYKP